MNQPANPYAAPQFQPPEPKVSAEPREPPAPPALKSVAKWMVVCAVSATPSFLVAVNLIPVGKNVEAVSGMVTGVMIFVIGYTLIERTERVQKVVQKRFVRRTAWIGYLTRMSASVILPIGAALDIACGLLSMWFSEFLIGSDAFKNFGGDGAAKETGIFMGFLITTITQGVIMNAVLLGYMLLVYGICWMLAAILDSRQ